MVRGETKQLFDKDGNLFIDQNPKYFPYLLEYLRTKGKSRTVPKASFDGVLGIATALRLETGFEMFRRE